MDTPHAEEVGSGVPALPEPPLDKALILPGLLFGAGIVALAVVPDAAILRPKVVWGRGLILGAAALLLLVQALRGKLRLPWAAAVLLGLMPGIMALLHPLHTDVASSALARDEIERLLLLPVALWTGACLLGTRRARDLFLFGLAVAGIVVGGWAVIQRTSSLFSLDLGVAPMARAQAGFGNPVFLGAWLVLATPLLVAEALTGPARTRWLAALAAGLCLPALLATASAGAWLGFGVALTTGLWILSPSWKLRIALLGVPVAVAAGVIATAHGMLLRPRAHALIWRDSWNLFRSHPGGVGPGQFQLLFPPFASEELLVLHPRHATIINDAHSEPLQILVELGWPALIAVGLAVVVLIAAVVATLRRGLPAIDRPRFAAAVAAGMGCLVLSFVSPDLRFVVSVLLLGSVLGLAAAQGEVAEIELRGGWAGRALLALVAVAALGGAAWSTTSRLQLTRLIAPRTSSLPTSTSAVPSEALIIELANAANADLGDPQHHFDLGLALARAKRHGEATAAFRQALRLVPTDPVVVRLLGITECLSGQFDGAVQHLAEALENDPDDHDARYLLAYACYGRGDLLQAATQIEELLTRKPDHAQARLLLQRLRE